MESSIIHAPPAATSTLAVFGNLDDVVKLAAGTVFDAVQDALKDALKDTVVNNRCGALFDALFGVFRAVFFSR